MRSLETYMDAFADFLTGGSSEGLAAFSSAEGAATVAKVYRNSSYLSCRDTLASNYPVVVKIVGADYFSGLAQAYVDRHPPASRSLVGYGDHLSAFLAETRHKHDLDYLADVARLDRAWLEAHLAENADAIPPDTLADMAARGEDISSATVTLHPSVRIVSTGWTVVALWRDLRWGAEDEGKRTVTPEPDHAVIWRHENEVQCIQIDAPTIGFLRGLRNGASLEAAAEQALEIDERFDVAIMLATCLQRGLIAAVNQ